jgi:hypothetical protein
MPPELVGAFKAFLFSCNFRLAVQRAQGAWSSDRGQGEGCQSCRYDSSGGDDRSRVKILVRICQQVAAACKSLNYDDARNSATHRLLGFDDYIWQFRSPTFSFEVTVYDGRRNGFMQNVALWTDPQNSDEPPENAFGVYQNGHGQPWQLLNAVDVPTSKKVLQALVSSCENAGGLSGRLHFDTGPMQQSERRLTQEWPASCALVLDGASPLNPVATLLREGSMVPPTRTSTSPPPPPRERSRSRRRRETEAERRVWKEERDRLRAAGNVFVPSE